MDRERIDAEAATRLAELGQRLSALMLDRAARDDGFRIPDPGVVASSLAALRGALAREPEQAAARQAAWAAQMEELRRRHLRRLRGESPPPLIEPDPSDRRFKDEAWRREPGLDYLMQAYLLTAGMLRDAVAGAERLEPATHARAAFYVQQMIEAAAPSNFPFINPVVLREARETRGQSLRRGLEKLLEDLERGRGELSISMSRPDAFRVGRDLATTPGKVVCENELIQLIQYAPRTRRVHRRPLLIVPPWINKFYVLDLRPTNSFIRFALDRGHTVFVISWVNPDARLAHKGFEDYLRDGPLAALDAIKAAVGEAEVNILGYCIGGTLTACLLAWLAARGERRIASATLLTTLTDFSDPGEIKVFIDDEQLSLLEAHMERKGYLEARQMRQVFSLLRPNDLIWSYVVNNYLLGRDPPAFDLLHWNADGTRMPCMMHRFYLRSMYQQNLLARPGGITLLGVPIDLGAIRTPCYFLSTREDHIAPWRSTYRGSRLLRGRHRFVLGEAGHIAGVVNPPASGKYGYWTNPRRPREPEAWLERAVRRPGSWWPDWAAWIARRGGGRVPARDPACGGLATIEDAPGRYVLVASED